jgi:hypothetical protein
MMAGSLTTVRATIIPVTTLSDNVAGSLRFAINAAVAGDTISFDLGLNGLLLPITAGELVVDKDLVIQGNGLLNTTLNAANFNRILRITNDASVRLENLSLIDGRASDLGGGIEDNPGAGTTFEVMNSGFERNSTGGSPGNGGGIHITGAGDLMITGFSFSDNTAAAEGGALWNGAGVMTIVDLTIDGNTASGNNTDQGGGGIYNLSGTVDISGSTTISNNVADGIGGSGGGILNDAGGSLTISGATISGNTSNRVGGGIERQVSYGAHDLDLSGLIAGTYLVQVYAKNSVETHKLMLLNK